MALEPPRGKTGDKTTCKRLLMGSFFFGLMMLPVEQNWKQEYPTFGKELLSRNIWDPIRFARRRGKKRKRKYKLFS